MALVAQIDSTNGRRGAPIEHLRLRADYVPLTVAQLKGESAGACAQVLLQGGLVSVFSTTGGTLEVFDLSVCSHVTIHMGGLLKSFATYGTVYIENVLMLDPFMEDQPLSGSIALSTDFTTEGISSSRDIVYTNRRS